MATTDLVVTSIISATGSWTGATVANLEASDDLRATGGVKNDTIKAEISNAPGDFGSQNSVTLKVEARVSGTTSRDRQVQVDLLDSADVVLETFTSGILTTTDQTFTSTVRTRSDSQTVIDGYRLLLTVIEGGGMADSASVEIDYAAAALNYEVAVASDDLLAEDVQSTSEVTAPSIGQTHALTAASVESASQTGSPAIGQTHSLAVVSVESASAVSSPTLSEGSAQDDLLAENVESASAVSTPALGQTHALTATSTEAASETATPVLGQTHSLNGTAAQSTSEVSSPSLGQTHGLLGVSVAALSEVSAPRLDRPGNKGGHLGGRKPSMRVAVHMGL